MLENNRFYRLTAIFFFELCCGFLIPVNLLGSHSVIMSWFVLVIIARVKYPKVKINLIAVRCKNRNIENGKPPEKVGRKARGLRQDATAAQPPIFRFSILKGERNDGKEDF
jgi:hypothetical protein